VRIPFLVHPVRCDAKFGNHVVYVAGLGENRFGADLARDIEGLAGVTMPKKIRWIERNATFRSVWLGQKIKPVEYIGGEAALILPRSVSQLYV